MPCCGLTEPRQRAPLHYTVAGVIVFWSAFAAVLIGGLATAWRPAGRLMLQSCAAFLAALWRETMRSPSSVPARWACRISGRLIPVSPAAAEFVFRHPELPVLLGVGLALVLLVGVVWLCSFWV